MGNPSSQSNGPLSQEMYTQGSGTTSSDPFITVFFPRDPDNTSAMDANYPVKKRWINTIAVTEWILTGFTNVTGQTLPIWKPLGNAGGVLELTGNNGGPVIPDSGNINVIGDGTTITTTGNILPNTLTISLIGGSAALQTLTVDHFDAPGTNPVLPSMGTISILGAAIPAHSIPIRTESDAANTIHIQNQLTSVSTFAGKTIANAGLASFDTASFTVDVPTGFVQLSTTGIVQSITGDDTIAVTPSGGTITVKGVTVTPNGTNPKAVFTKANGANEEDIQIQVSAAIAATDITKVGLSAFNNAQFTVDANGFVTIIGGSGPIEKFIMQTGTSPVQANGAGEVTVNGAAIGAGTNPVRSHGTGASTYQIEVQTSQAIATTNATNIGLSAFSNTQFTVDANGFVQMLHTPISNITVQTFTANGTYTPTVGMKFAQIEVVGGGGGGGGCVTNGAGSCSGGGGGAGAGYAKGLFSAGTVGVSQSVTVGGGGGGGAAGVNNGGTGGTTSVGALISATGGTGGGGSGSLTTPGILGSGSAGGVGSGGFVQVQGSFGDSAFSYSSGGLFVVSGHGGNSPYGNGNIGSGGNAGSAAGGHGAGGNGGSSSTGQAGTAGGAGSGGLVIITEYVFG